MGVLQHTRQCNCNVHGSCEGIAMAVRPCSPVNRPCHGSAMVWAAVGAVASPWLSHSMLNGVCHASATCRCDTDMSHECLCQCHDAPWQYRLFATKGRKKWTLFFNGYTEFYTYVRGIYRWPGNPPASGLCYVQSVSCVALLNGGAELQRAQRPLLPSHGEGA